MAFQRLGTIFSSRTIQLLTKLNNVNTITVRTKTKTKSGAILPQPQVTSFGIIRIILTVVPGLLIGAAISKNIANFLEENDLFVPSDDDDDDD